jgi:NADH:ubiquinone oxidoreductase subunit C
MIIGNPSIFAIESHISQMSQRLSERGLGFFVIYVKGNIYGIRSPNATMLGCSFDAVKRRIERRGTHTTSFCSDSDAIKIADSFCGARYNENRQTEQFFGMSADEFCDSIILTESIWAPDGDEAFDDGSHVLQFDQNDRVRLIAFKNSDSLADISASLSDIYVNSEYFYGILYKWHNEFEAHWLSNLNQTPME